MKKLLRGRTIKSFLLFTILFTFVNQNNLFSASITGCLTNLGASIRNHSFKLGKKACGLIPGSANKAIRFFTRPSMLKAEAVIAGLLVGYGLAKTAWNHALLYNTEGRLALKRMPWYLRTPGKSKIYNWNIENYPTASTIRCPLGIIPINEDVRPDEDKINQHQKSVIDNLVSYFPQVTTKDNYSQQFVSTHDYSQQLTRQGYYQSPDYYYQPREENIERKIFRVINAEIEELGRELQFAESYLLFPSSKFDLTGGIDEIIYDCCRQLHDHGFIREDAESFFAAFNENRLMYDQEMQLDRAVKNVAKTRFRHWVSLRPNFGKAVELCWEIKKRIKRLQALQGIILLS